ncbi:MAG: hypothetical protein Q4A32_12250 [Lachnospiraceae bacterium]|nr:hypothetical protein [Lachnospiraceae bacterium]
MRTKITKRAATLIIALVLGLLPSLLLASCGKKSGEDAISNGQIDQIGCFLFIFDKRSAQQQLVRDMDAGKIPTKMTAQLYNVIRNVDGTETEEAVKGKYVESEDEEFIKKVYYAITDLIVVGQMGIQNNPTRCRLKFELDDGQECELIFQSNASIEIGGQNYMLESSGRLWNLLEKIY